MQIMFNDKMNQEWKAWQDVVKHWPGDINAKTSDPLVKAIRLWGERLVALRLSQDPVIVQRALEEAQY